MTTPFVATQESIRERILAEMERLFGTQEKANDYLFSWSTVIRSPLLDGQARKNYELAILDRAETEEIQIQTYNAILNVDLEWSCLLSTKDVPSKRANKVILALKRRLHENIYMFEGGDNTGQQLALRAWTVGNDWSVDNDTDKRIDGVVFVRVEYKHKIDDPRRQIQ
jgi:hypothetical protein